MLAASTAVVLLLLALAGLLERLANDPGVLGKRYQLTADLPAESAPRVEEIDGVSAAAPRYVVEAADLFQLGARSASWPTPATTRASRPRRWRRAGACARRTRRSSG